MNHTWFKKIRLVRSPHLLLFPVLSTTINCKLYVWELPKRFFLEFVCPHLLQSVLIKCKLCPKLQGSKFIICTALLLLRMSNVEGFCDKKHSAVILSVSEKFIFMLGAELCKLSIYFTQRSVHVHVPSPSHGGRVCINPFRSCLSCYCKAAIPTQRSYRIKSA